MTRNTDAEAPMSHVVVMITERHELVLFSGLCIAVRDRRAGEWLEDHRWVGKRVDRFPYGVSCNALDLELANHMIRAQRPVLDGARVLSIEPPSAQTSAHVEPLLRHRSSRHSA